MTVLFISHYTDMYGANQSMLRLILELRNDYNIKPVVLLPAYGEICQHLKENDIKYYVSHFYWWVNDNNGIFQNLLNLRKQFRNLIRINKLVHLVNQEKIDLVYTNSITINIGVFISHKLKCYHIWHIRESLDQFKFKFSLGNFVSKLILKNGADKYILISNYLTTFYKDLIPKNKIKVIYNGIDFSRINLKKDKISNTFNLCMVGIISNQKNNMDAIKALSILINKYKLTNIRLHLIGGNKIEYLNLINNYIDENGLREFVVFHGHIKNIDELLSSMHLGLMCSCGEAFGRVTVEYFMHSMPVIASNSGANPELIKENINGLLYCLYDTNELANKIYKFVNNSNYMKQIGQTAYQFGIDNFSSKQNTALIFGVIKDLILSNKTSLNNDELELSLHKLN